MGVQTVLQLPSPDNRRGRAFPGAEDNASRPLSNSIRPKELKSWYSLLLVDDDKDIVNAFKLGLERQGFAVDAFSDPAEALRRRAGPYDLAIFDIKMPQMTGFELYRSFRMIDRETPVVFITAFEMDESEFKNLPHDPGVKGILRKPIRTSQLALAIEKIISEG